VKRADVCPLPGTPIGAAFHLTATLKSGEPRANRSRLDEAMVSRQTQRS